MHKDQKQLMVSSLREDLGKSALVVVTKQSGLTVDEVNDLRRKVREAGAKYRVAKNTLVKLAVKETEVEPISSYMSGPTALSYSEDPVAAAKAVVEFSKDNKKLEVVAGILNGKELSLAEVVNLASLPSMDELRAKIISVIQAPATKVAGVTQAPAGQLARVFGAYGAKS